VTEYFPVSQLVHAVSPVVAPKEPATQLTQEVEPGADEYFPEGQEEHAVEDDAPVVVK